MASAAESPFDSGCAPLKPAEVDAGGAAIVARRDRLVHAETDGALERITRAPSPSRPLPYHGMRDTIMIMRYTWRGT